MFYSSPRRRAVAWAIPLVLALASMARTAEHVRTVDLVKILASGVVIGVSLMNIIDAFRSRSTPQP